MHSRICPLLQNKNLKKYFKAQRTQIINSDLYNRTSYTTIQCGKIWRSGHVFFVTTSCHFVILTLTLSFQIFMFLCILFLFLLFRTNDDLDSDVEEVLYSQVHYASALVVSKNSTPGMNVFCLSRFF